MEYTSRLQSKDIDSLFEAIKALETDEECYRFFEDLVTIKELQAMAQRWQVAKCLSKKMTYVDIEKETGASAATISRINRCISYGSDGYKIMLEKLQNK